MVTLNINSNDSVLKTDEKDISKIYKIHKYWSRKPWKPISNSIKKYSKEKDLVVDLFLGSGVTCLESITLNRNFVGYDINPMATFIANNTVNNHFKENIFLDELQQLKAKLELFFYNLYSVKDSCKTCGKKLIIDHLNIGPKFKGKEEGTFFCSDCGKTNSIKKRLLTKEEIKNINKDYQITDWVPKRDFPKKFYKDRFSYKGVKEVADFYTKRNLYALSKLLHEIKASDTYYKDLFLLAFSNTVLHSSKLKSENVRPLNVNNYWIPDDYMEENVWLRFLERADLVFKSKMSLKDRFTDMNKIGDYRLINKSSFKTEFKDGEVDYIITDPPYGDTIQYFELSFIWNAWMDFEFNNEEEIIINPVQHKGKEEYLTMLRVSIKEASRILKNNGMFTLCFHNKEFKIWQGILNSFKQYNFALEDIEIVETLGNSYNNNWSKFSPKSDIYLTFRKTKLIKNRFKNEFSLKEFIRSVLKENKTKDISVIYDALVSKLIWEIYYNENEVDVSKLTIKKLSEILIELENANR